MFIEKAYQGACQFCSNNYKKAHEVVDPVRCSQIIQADLFIIVIH